MPLQLEDGSYLLLESSDKLLLEDENLAADRLTMVISREPDRTVATRRRSS